MPEREACWTIYRSNRSAEFEAELLAYVRKNQQDFVGELERTLSLMKRRIAAEENHREFKKPRLACLPRAQRRQAHPER